MQNRTQTNKFDSKAVLIYFKLFLHIKQQEYNKPNFDIYRDKQKDYLSQPVYNLEKGLLMQRKNLGK